MVMTLESWHLSYGPDLASALNNPLIHEQLRDGLPLPYTLTHAEQFIQSILDAPPHSQYLWAIVVDGKAVGSIGIHRQQNIHRQTAELGYFLAQPYWNRKIMTSAVEKACEQVFLNTDLLRIFAQPFATNLASCRVLEKAGFQCEGILRQNAVKGGKVLDMKLYAKIKALEPPSHG